MAISLRCFGFEGLVGHLAVNHETRQVRQSLGDAVVLAGLAANRPAHPPRHCGVDGLLDRVAPKHLVEDVIRKVASVAAVEEQSDRLEGLVGGVRDRGHRDRPGCFGVVVHRAKKPPGFYAVHHIKAFMWSELLCGVQCRGTADGLCQG